MGLEFRNKDSVSYCAGWAKALKNNKKMLIHAAQMAEKAAKYVKTGEKVE
jgi:antirestriction protein ArdC